MRVALFFACFLFLHPMASAQMIGDARCKDRDYIAKWIGEIDVNLKAVAELIEAVPPDHAQYLREELRIALDQGNENRYNLAASNRFYYSLMFHDDYRVASDNLAAARRSNGKETTQYLIVVLSRIGELSRRVDDYIKFDSSRPNAILTKSNRDTIYFRMPSAKQMTVSLLQCLVSQL